MKREKNIFIDPDPDPVLTCREAVPDLQPVVIAGVLVLSEVLHVEARELQRDL